MIAGVGRTVAIYTFTILLHKVYVRHNSYSKDKASLIAIGVPDAYIMMRLSTGFISDPAGYRPGLLFVERRRYNPHRSKRTCFGTREHRDLGDFGEPGNACDPETWFFGRDAKSRSLSAPAHLQRVLWGSGLRNHKSRRDRRYPRPSRHPERATLIAVSAGGPRDLTVQ